MTTEAAPKGQLMYLGLAVLVLLSGLCTIFASVVTAAQAWQEHAQARWPEVTARVDTCGLDQTSSGPRTYYIHCRLSYAVGAEQNVANVYSTQRSFAASLAIPAQPDCAVREVGGCAPPRNADRRALRSRQPQESSAGGDRYAARRTTNAEQYEAT